MRQCGRCGVDMALVAPNGCRECRPSHAEALIYERGGYLPHGLAIDARGIDAVRHALPLVGEGVVARIESPMHPPVERVVAHGAQPPPCVAKASGWKDCQERNAETGRMDECPACVSQGPAATLAEAVALANRAEALAFGVLHSPSGPAVEGDVTSARVLLTEAVKALMRAAVAIKTQEATHG